MKKWGSTPFQASNVNKLVFRYLELAQNQFLSDNATIHITFDRWEVVFSISVSSNSYLWAVMMLNAN